MTNAHNVIAVLTMLMTLSGIGCAGRGFVRQEYVLNPTTGAGAASDLSAASRDVAIGVGPVSIPSYLRRPQIVTRVGEHELSASDAHSWGEDLRDSFTRVVTQNLARMVPTVRVVAFPIASPVELDYRVAIRVDRYERDENEDAVVLDAGWVVARAEGGDVVVARQATVREPLQGDSYAEAVAAMSRAGATLSREIADVIRADARSRAGR